MVLLRFTGEQEVSGTRKGEVVSVLRVDRYVIVSDSVVIDRVMHNAFNVMLVDP